MEAKSCWEGPIGISVVEGGTRVRELEGVGETLQVKASSLMLSMVGSGEPELDLDRTVEVMETGTSLLVLPMNAKGRIGPKLNALTGAREIEVSPVVLSTLE